MKWNDISKEDILNVLGVATKPSPASRVFGAVLKGVSGARASDT